MLGMFGTACEGSRSNVGRLSVRCPGPIRVRDPDRDRFSGLLLPSQAPSQPAGERVRDDLHTLFHLTGRTALVTGSSRGIGYAVVFRSSTASDSVNGQTIYVDGGMAAVI